MALASARDLAATSLAVASGKVWATVASRVLVLVPVPSDSARRFQAVVVRPPTARSCTQVVPDTTGAGFASRPGWFGQNARRGLFACSGTKLQATVSVPDRTVAATARMSLVA